MGEIEEGKEGLNGDGRKLDSGYRAQNAIYRYIIELYICNLCNFINNVTPINSIKNLKF